MSKGSESAWAVGVGAVGVGINRLGAEWDKRVNESLGTDAAEAAMDAEILAAYRQLNPHDLNPTEGEISQFVKAVDHLDNLDGPDSAYVTEVREVINARYGSTQGELQDLRDEYAKLDGADFVPDVVQGLGGFVAVAAAVALFSILTSDRSRGY